jgi:hypothetical protein
LIVFANPVAADCSAAFRADAVAIDAIMTFAPLIVR